MAYGKCFLNGEYGIVERHHIFGGPFRQKSERYGLVVELSPQMHQHSPFSAHRCGETARKLKRYGQMKVMIEQGWDEERFIREFGKSYLFEGDEFDIQARREEQRPTEPTLMNTEANHSENGSAVRCGEVTVRFTVLAEVLPF